MTSEQTPKGTCGPARFDDTPLLQLIEGEITISRRAELLTEYQQCGKERSESQSRVSQMTSVAIAVFSLSAIVIAAVIGKADLSDELTIVLVIMLVIFGVSAAQFWRITVAEELFSQRIAYLRMVEIEAAIDFRLHLRDYILREVKSCRTKVWHRLSPSEQKAMMSELSHRSMLHTWSQLQLFVRVPGSVLGHGGILLSTIASLVFIIAAAGIAYTTITQDVSDSTGQNPSTTPAPVASPQQT